MSLIFSDHAIVRCKQRGIPIKVVEFVVEHGKSIRTHNDSKFFISKKKFNSIKRNNPDFVAKNDKHLLSTAVVMNGRHVITCMKKKSKKFNWN
tara:strand:- start:198 stop:476 length:279 start_codon:yes stop_codon:yes gene_type:complete